ncbi:MAG: hypothetical protein Q8Q69_07000 [Nitrosopumilaceae archaeon]|jgi:hypothetical protein|nr:hypothetical protein [Nitrosopumilaceae archaeon]
MTSLPLINQAYEKIKENGSLTDEELSKSLAKSGIVIPEDRFNKILLDLEILGKIRVSWLTKDTRRIEAITEEEEIDEVDLQNKESMEKDYEASFPGMENNE